MLEVRNIETGYGKKQVLFGVSLEVNQGEIVAIIGPNGSGKSTTLKAICGLIPAWSGDIRFGGVSINGSTPARNVARGITFAPQGNRVFNDLTVTENLEIGGFQLPRKELKTRMEQVYAMFPVLKRRARQDAGKLSAGEQQMLALGRALMPRPRLLMLDEPSLGLSPGLVDSVFEMIRDLNKDNPLAILIVEQKVKQVLAICDRVYSLKLGRVEYSGGVESLIENPEKLRELFL
jgi:branched-chain amino acid transport system ATP-binding protein